MSRLKPEGAGAVMADRARGEVEGDTPEEALWRKLNFFPTPPWAARAGGELIRRLDPHGGSCWEPACGQGHMALGLFSIFKDGVLCTDIHDFGAGPTCDFLGQEADDWGHVDWVVTNPPFETAAQFVQLGLQRARRGVAMLCRSAWLDSHGRYPLFYGPEPLSVHAPFFERVTMTLGGRPTKKGGGTATAYSWFVWVKPETDLPIVAAVDRLRAEFGDSNITLPIGVGTKARLSRADDLQRLKRGLALAPLFDGGAE
jgi:hypothetical protein